MSRILITGHRGFIGSYLEKYFRNRGHEVVGMDKQDGFDMSDAKQWIGLKYPGLDYIINTASISSVDYSIKQPYETVRNNVISLLNLLDWLRTEDKERKIKLLHLSTDEIYGDIEPGHSVDETGPYEPTNPYSGSKAAQECLLSSYHYTYSLNISVINCCNIFGPNQSKDKFIPFAIDALINNRAVPIHCTNAGVIGTRCWQWVGNVAAYCQYLLTNCKYSKWHLEGPEITNLRIVLDIAAILGKEAKVDLVQGTKTRPYYDSRYHLSSLGPINSLDIRSNLQEKFKETILSYIS